MKYVGVDWAYRQAQWCALTGGGEVAGEGRIAADRDGLARLVLELGDEVKTCLEMMSGALWVRDQLEACGWQVEVADARKVKTVAQPSARLAKRPEHCRRCDGRCRGQARRTGRPLACQATALRIAEDNSMQRTSLCAAADAGR